MEINIDPGDLPTFFDNYIFLDEVGRGAMKIVIRAFDTREEVDVAVAIMKRRYPSDEEERRFLRETRALQILSHPNIIKVLRADVFKGQPFFVMEYISGDSLSKKLLDGPMTIGEIVLCMSQVCDGIAYAHRQKILHRDIKPDNLLFTDDGLLKVADFGLAKNLDDSENLTRTGQALGTVYYVSPEQLNGKDVSHWSDIYSLGVTLLEMTLGRKPFLELMRTQSPFEVASKRRRAPEVSGNESLRRLYCICERCLEELPDARFDSVDTLASALEFVRTPASSISESPYHELFLI